MKKANAYKNDFKSHMAEMESQEQQSIQQAEVHGKAAQKRKVSPLKTSETVGESVVPVPVVKQFESFEEILNFEDEFANLASQKCALDSEIAELQMKQNDIASQVSILVQEGGLDAKTSGDNMSRVLFVNPYKAQIKYEQVAGDIDMDAIRKHFPSMIVTEKSAGRLDMQALENNLKNITGMSFNEAEQVKAAINLLRTTALKLDNRDIYSERVEETVKDEFLIMLNEGKVAPNLKAEIMSSESKLSASIRIESLVSKKHGRCGFCGYEKKAVEAKDPKFICPSCGQ